MINIRERHFLSEFPTELEKLRKKKLDPFVLFFEASDEALQTAIFGNSAPSSCGVGPRLTFGRQSRKKAMKEIRPLADLIIDSSEHTVHTLRRLIVDKFGATPHGTPFRVQVVSFGHKLVIRGTSI